MDQNEVEVMDLSNKLTVGQVVKSRAGRDNGKIFLVLKVINDQYVHIVDGDLRKLNNPKKKKVRHLTIYNTVITEFQEKLGDAVEVNDAYVRRVLEPFNKSI
ncbi:hypothetical protein E9840_07360 [Tissierella creatinini]|nr:hypothetical protein E9840_07360 [Tissierella creatinini]TJX66014.1 hypothetical protein E8P77_08975 [Soehngenia saccharolytica]